MRTRRTRARLLALSLALPLGAALPAQSTLPAQSAPEPPARAAASPQLLVLTHDEVLTVAWSAEGASRVVARVRLDDASDETRRQLTPGVVHDAHLGKVYRAGDGWIAIYDVDGATGRATASRTVPGPMAPPSAGGDLAPIPGSDELLSVDGQGVWLFDAARGCRRPHPRFADDSRVRSIDVDPTSHRIAFIESDVDAPSRTRVRFTNPEGELPLPDVSPTLVRWRRPDVPGAPGPALTSELPPPAALTVGLDAPAETRLAFGSCADEDAGTARVWRLLGALAPSAVVLLGDTPYIDSTDPEVLARRQREFAAFAPFAELARCTPVFATWDDHDFGANDSDGNLIGKEHARDAFIAAHTAQAHPPRAALGAQATDPPTYGADGAGVYSSFRSGSVEVFLLDTRWFARTEPSEFDPQQPTLLGAAQWHWLREGLRASQAPFKVLACGMIWNGAVRPGKTDHWGAYPAEFDGLCRFLGAARISGVVLVGGDIHRARVVEHDTRASVGYPLTELISSPMHGRVIETADAPHPGLRFDSGAGHVVCIVAATPRDLRATFQTPTDVLFEVTLQASALTAAR